MDAHRHQWSVAGFAVEEDRPVMRQSCVVCRAERTVGAWDRTWKPAAEWRLVTPVAGATAGRLMEPVLRGPFESLGDRDRVTDPIRIDAWSDIACPWCYIGKRNLETGIAAYRDGDPASSPIEVEYHSFELAPDTPIDFEGSELDYLAGIKGISREQAQAMLDRVATIAADAGLRYDFASVKHTRTVKAHQLLHLAKARGRQHELAERLFGAYFAEGRHIGRDDELAELASEVGLDRDEVLSVLREDTFLADVRADQQQAVAYGIRGVPFFVLAGRYGLSGAQPPEVFAEAIGRLADERVAIGEATIG